MSDDKNKKTPLSTSGRKTLQMKPSGASGAGGGASGVVVQRKKKLIMPGQHNTSEATTEKPKSIIKTPFGSGKKVAEPEVPVEDVQSGGLSESEREKRAKVLEQAQKDADVKAKNAVGRSKTQSGRRCCQSRAFGRGSG
jgi:hypothetical protein